MEYFTEHTPGPWQVARFDPSRCWAEIETVERGVDVPDQGYSIGGAYTAPEEPGPNAILMAAAPELLKALRQCADALRDHVQYEDDEGSSEGDAYRAAQSIIAKATGKAWQ